MAAARGEAPAQVAIAWMLSKPAVAAPIVGVTKLHHLDDPLKAVESPLSEEEITELAVPYAPQAVIGALRPEDVGHSSGQSGKPVVKGGSLS